MLIKEKRAFIKGLVLAIGFLVVLVIMFLPLLDGDTALTAADKLFNSISKGSTNFIPDLMKKSEAYNGTALEVNVTLKDREMAQKVTKLFSAAGAQASGAGAQLKVKGDLGRISGAALEDSYAMFNNREAEVSSKYGFPGKEVLYLWWSAFKEVDKDLKKQERFKEAAFLAVVVKKGVEVGYNFYQIEPQTARSKAGILTFSLIFYVIYTLWWGIAILFLFEGFGLQMTAGSKKEV